MDRVMSSEEIREMSFDSLEPPQVAVEVWSLAPPARPLGRTQSGDITFDDFLAIPESKRPPAWTRIDIDMVKVLEKDGYTMECHADLGDGWHHYAVTYDGLTGFVSRYVDGVRVTKRQWRKRYKMPSCGLVTGGRPQAWRSDLRRELHGYKVKTKRRKR